MKIYGGNVEFKIKGGQVVLYVGGLEFAIGKRLANGKMDIEPGDFEGTEESVADVLSLLDMFYDIYEQEDILSTLSEDAFIEMVYNVSLILVGAADEMLKHELNNSDAMVSFITKNQHDDEDIGRIVSFAAFEKKGSEEASAGEVGALALEHLVQEQPEEAASMIFNDERLLVLTRINGDYSLVAITAPSANDIAEELLSESLDDDEIPAVLH